MINKKTAREIIYLILAFLGASNILLNTYKYGIGLTDDSVNYIYSGIHLLQMKGFYNYDGSIFINWPPLYSLIISIISGIGFDIYTALIIFNAIIFGLTVYLLGKLSEIIFTSSIIKILYVTTLTFSFQMLFIFTRAWSETIFILLIIIIILTLLKNPEQNVIYLILFLSLCVLTRYLGISLVISYYIYFAFIKTGTSKPLKTYSSKTLLISAIAIIPTCLWFIRNRLMTNNITNISFNSTESLFSNINRLLEYTSALFIPESIDAQIRILLLVVLGGFTMWFFIKSKVYSDNKLITLISIIYIISLLIISNIFKFDNISYRFLIPVYFILLALIIRTLEVLILKLNNKITKVLLSIFLALTIIFPIEKGIKHTFINYNDGIEGFNSIEWKESETIEYIESYDKNSKIYSNSPAGIYVNTGLSTYRISNYPHERLKGTLRVIFKKSLPEIDNVPDLLNTISQNDSIIYLKDSYIIITKN